MPRPNAPRSIDSERVLARNVAHYREERGYSYDSLAARMTLEGCPIHASALHKIEKSDPPRRITVDELQAFSRVFGVPIGRLLLPLDKVLANLVERLDRAERAAVEAQDVATKAWDAMVRWVAANPEYEGQLQTALIEVAKRFDYGEDSERLGTFWMSLATRADMWEEQYLRQLSAERLSALLARFDLPEDGA